LSQEMIFIKDKPGVPLEAVYIVFNTKGDLYIHAHHSQLPEKQKRLQQTWVWASEYIMKDIIGEFHYVFNFGIIKRYPFFRFKES